MPAKVAARSFVSARQTAASHQIISPPQLGKLDFNELIGGAGSYSRMNAAHVSYGPP